MGDLGFEPRTNGLRVRCAAIAPVTLDMSAFLSFSIMSDFLAISKNTDETDKMPSEIAHVGICRYRMS